MSIFTKIKFMKPDEAVAYANNPDNADEISKLDETCKQMLQKKLTKAMSGKVEPEEDLNALRDVGFEAVAEEFQQEIMSDTPKIQRFICNRFPDKWILQGNKSIRFKGGLFLTDDPELIEAIVNQPDFGLWIIADDPELMKRRKRMK